MRGHPGEPSLTSTSHLADQHLPHTREPWWSPKSSVDGPFHSGRGSIIDIVRGRITETAGPGSAAAAAGAIENVLSLRGSP